MNRSGFDPHGPRPPEDRSHAASCNGFARRQLEGLRLVGGRLLSRDSECRDPRALLCRSYCLARTQRDARGRAQEGGLDEWGHRHGHGDTDLRFHGGLSSPKRQIRYEKIGALLVGLGVCIGMARYAKSAQAAREKTEVEFQKKWSAAQTQIDEGKRRLVPTFRAEGRRQQEDAEKWRDARLAEIGSIWNVDTIQRVAGPALTEIVWAELLAFLAFLWAGVRPSEASSHAPQSEDVHPSLAGVNLDRLADLCPAAIEGLDRVQGTWRGLILNDAKVRGKGARRELWPTLAGAPVAAQFIGTKPAIKYAEGMARRTATRIWDGRVKDEVGKKKLRVVSSNTED